MPDLKSTLQFIKLEADNDDIDLVIAEAIKRRRALQNMRGAQVRDNIEVGARIRLVDSGLKPKYLHGLVGKVISLDMDKALVDFGRPVGKYKSGRINCPFVLIAEVLK